MQTIKLECLATANRVMAVIRRIHREMDSDFQINSTKDRRITTGRVNQKEILQRESHMRIRTRNKLGGENQRIKESLNRVHQEDLVVDVQGQMMTRSVVIIVIQISILFEIVMRQREIKVRKKNVLTFGQ